jgi:hypothetical protein
MSTSASFSAPGLEPSRSGAEIPAQGDDLDVARALLAAPYDVLARVWERLDALAKHRKIDFELRRRILRVAEKVAPTLVEQLELELDVAAPAAVLAAHQTELIPDRPALGAFPAASKMTAPSIDAWIIEDPTRLRGVVAEVARFCKDDRRVVESVLVLADQLGIDQHLAGSIIGPALRDVRHPKAAAQ